MIMINTVEDVKKLLEEKERTDMEALRAALRLNSLTDAAERFEQVGLSCATALHMAEEAYVVLAEDELDDWDTAQEKANKLNRIEHEHDRLIAVWENQLRRLNWESRQAQQTL